MFLSSQSYLQHVPLIKSCLIRKKQLVSKRVPRSPPYFIPADNNEKLNLSSTDLLILKYSCLPTPFQPPDTGNHGCSYTVGFPTVQIYVLAISLTMFLFPLEGNPGMGRLKVTALSSCFPDLEEQAYYGI